MKKIIYILLLLTVGSYLADGQVIYQPTGSARGLNRFLGALTVDSAVYFGGGDTSSSYFPRTEGLIKYNKANKTFYFFNGSTWNSLGGGAGSGTLTSVSVSASNGIGVSGSPITSSGTISLSLGNITPTSVAATGTVGGSNLSGTNTGDQTNITGNAGTVTNGVYTSRTISTTAPLAGGGDLSANRTFSIANAAADGSTKGAAAFSASDFNSTSGVVAIDYTNAQAATASAKGFLIPTDWSFFNGKQDQITLTTIGTSGDATFVGNVLNIPNYSSGGGGGGSGTVNTGLANRLAYYSASGTTVDDLAAITSDRALVSDANGLPVASTVTTTTLGFLDATSSVQTQINGKQASLGFTPENSANKATSLLSPNNTTYPTTLAVSNAISSAGGGSVTSVSVTTANGVSGSVANATSTPAITLTLGAITPTSVTASGTVSGSNLSGTNTGDQTNITGNAGTVTNGVYTTRTISTTSPLAGGGDLSANRTLSIADAAADGSTKGASTFASSDFNATSGVISIDYANGQTATSSTKGLLLAADWIRFDGKQAALGYTPEDVANKSTNTSLGGSNTLYPSQLAVKTYVDNAIILAGGYTDEQAQDAVGAMVSSEFTYTDATPLLSINTIAESKVTNLVSNLAAKAPLASPTFTGVPAAPTATAGTNTTQIATTAFVTAAATALNATPTTRTISTTSPLAGGGDLSANRTLSIVDAAADGTTKGASTYTSADFNSSAGLISLDYTNGQAATSSVKGYLTPTDYIVFNAKQPQLNGTGFVKATGTTISYDNSNYYLASNPNGYTTNTGTVTSVSATGNNGISVSGSPVTTTGTLTLGLGAITPTSVAASGTVTGSNLSGTNTGDQTNITGNAGTATSLQTGRTISITGDLAYTSPSFNGTANITAAGTLATVNSNVGSFSNPTFTVNAKGLVTAASSGATPWSLTGNSGLTSGDFLGSTDATDLRFRTNNSQRLRIDGTGVITSSLTTGATSRGLDFNTSLSEMTIIDSDMGHTSKLLLNTTSGTLSAIGNSSDTISSFSASTTAATIAAPIYNGGLLIQNLNSNNNFNSIAVFNGDTLKKVPRYSTTPVITLGAGAGTGATYSIVGDDKGGEITINTGTLPATGNQIAQFALPNTHPNGASMVVFPKTQPTIGADIFTSNLGFPNYVFIMSGSVGLTPTGTYTWNYIIQGY